MKISAVIHTFNSEKYLKECLESLASLDEIIICDMYSTDRTIEIAKEYNCKIIYHENVGFADPARNFAISQASNNWIFVVDSDEIIPQKLIEYFEKQIHNPQCPDVFYIPRKNYYFGKFITHTYPDHQIRFFKKGHASWTPYVHTFPELKGSTCKISANRQDLAIIHYTYDTISAFVSRINKYTTFEVDKLKKKKRKPTLVNILLSPTAGFFSTYFLQKAYKDGKHGFLIAMLIGYYKFLAIIKLWEQEENVNI